jgi:phage tail-like protein
MKFIRYQDYLPPVLWRDDPDPSVFSLGQLLRIFEKMLTGQDDDVPIAHGDHDHTAITAQIAAIDGLFDPWRVRSDFLPWLASWVALEFPALQDRPVWDEYQRRTAMSRITRIYRERGLKSGMARYIDLYAAGLTPRVALDDGSRILVTTPRPAQFAPVTALGVQGPVIKDTSVVSEGVIRPWCAAMAPDGHIFVADIGVPSTEPVAVKRRVWRLSPTGQYDLTGNPPQPQPVAPDTLTLNSVIAVVVRPLRPDASETLYVLELSGQLWSVPSPYLGQQATKVTTLKAGGSSTPTFTPAISPVAMAVDHNGDLLVLDRGNGAGSPNPPQIVTVSPQASPVTVTRTPLRQVIEPLSLLVRSGGSLVIGDGRTQKPVPTGEFAGNLVQVDRGSPAHWTETLLMAPANPLVAPTAVTEADETSLHVLDAGLKPFAPSSAADPFVLPVAKSAGVFRVDLALGPPTATRVTEQGQMVYPTGMVADGDRLVICDPGLPTISGIPTHLSRLRPFHLDVVVHFTASQLPVDEASRAAVFRQVKTNIEAVVEKERPAHVEWNVITQGPG